MQSNKTFRVFISSTFNDLKVERDVLQREVFPEIQEYCEAQGYRFQAIDLRWGVSNEAGLDHKAMKICLDEVKRSLNHPKPNLIVLMGDRYGWIPLPTVIEKSLFEKLVSKIDAKVEQDLLYAWYRLNSNIIPEQYTLQPIQKVLKISDPDTLAMKWQETEKELLLLLQNAVKKCDDIDSQLFFTSATEQEIQSGVLEVEDPNRVLVLDRYITNLKEIHESDLLEVYTDKGGEKRLLNLKNMLKKQTKVKYHLFETELEDRDQNLRKLNKYYLDAYVKESKIFLKENIDLEIERINKLKNRDVELAQHRIFMEERSESFIGRNASIENVITYISDVDNHSPYILHGESGVGKSALMAKLVTKLKKDRLIYRFIGITEKSSVPIMFLNDLISEIENILSIESSAERLSNEYDVVVNRFIELLNMCKNGSQLIIIIDALDQFTEYTKLEWIEEKLPANVKLVISTLPGQYLDTLKDKIPPENFEEVKPLNIEDGKNILDNWLKASSRKLSSNQYEKIITNFEKNGLPLYLKIAFEESLHWHSYTETLVLDETLEGIIHGYIDRLIAREYHSKELVEHVLGYISAAKNGLSEDELYEILSKDEVVMQAISNPHHKIQPVENVAKLPAAIWARFYADLLKHLSLTNKDNILLLNFYHRKISETIRDYYYAPDSNLYHAKLTEYFLTQPSEYIENSSPRYNLRKNSELPYQLYKSGAYRLFTEYYDLDTLQIKSKRNHILQALLELHNTYNAIDVSGLHNRLRDELKEQLCETLIAYLLTRVKQTDSALLSVEAIHATYVYRDEKKFYNQILEMASDRSVLQNIYLKYENVDTLEEKNLLRYFVAFKARFSNKIRRETKLSEAFENYSELIDVMQDHELNNKADFNELSKIEYDMGYIRYLQGESTDAMEYMDKSIVSCEKAEKPINSAISRCLKYRIGFLSGIYEAAEFDEVLDNAYKVFYESRLKNSNAKRWVRNTLAHKFEIAYSKKDIEESHRLFNLLKNDAWKLEFKNENRFTSDLADYGRILILEEKYEKAIEAFQEYIYSYLGSLEERQQREAVARDYYDYLLALQGKGDMQEFSKVLKELHEDIPNEPGNLLWKKRAKQIQKE